MFFGICAQKKEMDIESFPLLLTLPVGCIYMCD